MTDATLSEWAERARKAQTAINELGAGPPCDHEYVPGWMKCEPSWRWTDVQQWPDDVPKVGCRRCSLILPITVRQLEVLRLAATGMPHARVGKELGISEQTVKNHLSSAYRKLDARNETEAFVNIGWLRVP